MPDPPSSYANCVGRVHTMKGTRVGGGIRPDVANVAAKGYALLCIPEGQKATKEQVVSALSAIDKELARNDLTMDERNALMMGYLSAYQRGSNDGAIPPVLTPTMLQIGLGAAGWSGGGVGALPSAVEPEIVMGRPPRVSAPEPPETVPGRAAPRAPPAEEEVPPAPKPPPSGEKPPSVFVKVRRPLGRGSTANLAKGTTLPRTLLEELAVQQVMSHPEAGTKLPVPMTDKRWPGDEGWVKMQQIVPTSAGDVNVHYVRNVNTGDIDDFKIKLR